MPAFWDTARHLMITHTCDSHHIPSQKKTKSKLQIFKIWNNSNFEILQEMYMRQTLWSYLIICINMKWIQNCRCYRHGMRDGRTDRRTDEWSATSIPPQHFRCAGGGRFKKSPKGSQGATFASSAVLTLGVKCKTGFCKYTQKKLKISFYTPWCTTYIFQLYTCKFVKYII